MKQLDKMTSEGLLAHGAVNHGENRGLEEAGERLFALPFVTHVSSTC